MWLFTYIRENLKNFPLFSLFDFLFIILFKEHILFIFFLKDINLTGYYYNTCLRQLAKMQTRKIKKKKMVEITLV